MANRAAQIFLWALGYLLSGLYFTLGAAEIIPESTSLARDGAGLTLTLSLSAPTPFKVYTLDNPRRLLVDLGDTSLDAMPAGLVANIPEISGLRYGLFQLGESRIVLDLAVPLVVQSAVAGDGAGGAGVTIRLVPASAEEFAAQSAKGANALWRPEQLAANIAGGAGLPLVAIDAGHGGPDNGAEQGGAFEKDIVLQVAQRLRDVLLEDGRFRAVLTRESDIFIPLGERVEIARRAGADVFVSLHADVVTLGRARGTTVFSISEAGADQQAVTIATLENRADLVAGYSVEGEDDQIAQVLLQLAHRQTDALSNRFADIMAETLWFQNDSEIKSRRMAAGFRVLRAPDIPSVLVELGFMSDKTDLENLQNPDWQLAMAENLRDGLAIWLREAPEMRGLLRN